MPVINVDNTPREDGRKSIKAQASDIQQARADLASQNSILQASVNDYSKSSSDIIKNYNDFNDAIKVLKENIKKLNKDAQSDINEFLKTIGISKKQLQNFSNEYDRTNQAFKRMTKEGNATGEQFVDTVKAMEDMSDEIGDLTGLIKLVTKNFNTLNDTTKESIKQKANELKNIRTETRQSNEKFKADYLRNEKIANQNVGKAVKEEIGKLGDNLSQLINTLNINRIAQQVAVSAKQQLQGELQLNYNLSASEFNKFKRDLYDQIDLSIYSNDEIVAAMQTLNTTALGNTQTATQYFNDIIRGQKVLGISSEAQQQLLKLGNKTGRNELSFYQGTVAKFLNSNLGLNKQQLNELVSLNANFASQAADLGITSEAFQEMQMKTYAALEATQPGSGAKLVQAEQALLTNTNATAALLGLKSSEVQANYNKGISLPEMILNAQDQTGAKTALNAIRNGDEELIGDMKEWAADAWGADADAVWSLLNVLAKNEDEFNSNFQTVTEAAMQDAQQALRTEEEKQTESLNIIQTTINAIQNNLDKVLPWTIVPLLTAIGVGITTIISLMRINGNIYEILKGLAGKNGISVGTLTKAGGLKGLLGKTALGSGSLTAAQTAFGWGGIAAGTIMGISDAITMQGSTGKGVLADSARGFFLGTGSKEMSQKDKDKSTGMNALKWGAIGAGAGMLIGGPAGAVIGGALGAVAGGIAGLVGVSKENKKLQQEQNEELKDIESNTATTASNTKKDSVGFVYRYRGTDNYSTEVGATTGNGYVGSIVNTGTSSGLGVGMPEGIHVNSPYGERKPILLDNGTWSKPFHNGIDLRASEGTPLYSNVNGYVSMNLTEKSGCNIVGVTDANNYTHLYAHMKERSPLKINDPVSRGQFVGYAGKTGGVTGAHLHYSIVKPGKTGTYWQQGSVIDPTPYVTSTIFNGDASSIIADINGSSADMSDIDSFTRPVTTLQLEQIGEISGPIVNSIGDLKQTIIDLSTKTDRNEKILNMLTNRTTTSPIV